MNRSPGKPSYRAHRVLVVDDNLDHLHTFAMLLKEMGHTVDYAINGYVALDVARRFKPDVVILDLGLPGVTGFEVCQQIRSDPELADVKIYALTGFQQDEYRKRAQDVGFDGFFNKPLDPRQIAELFGDFKDSHVR